MFFVPAILSAHWYWYWDDFPVGSGEIDCGFAVSNAHPDDKQNQGGYIMAGVYDGNDLYLVRMQPYSGTLDTFWAKSPLIENHEATSIKPTKTFFEPLQNSWIPGYIITGFRYTPRDIFLLRTYLNGNPISGWPKWYAEGRGNSVQNTSDNGSILVGLYPNPDTTWGKRGDDWYILKTNNAGVPQWTTIFGDRKDDVAWEVQQCAEGGYIVVGTLREPTDTTDTFIYIMYLTQSGQIIWRSRYSIPGGREQGHSVQQLPDSGFIVAGTVHARTGSSKQFLWRTTSYGGTRWTREYTPAGHDSASGWSVKVNRAGNYVVAGDTRQITSLYVDTDIFLTETNSSGTLVNSTVYHASVDSCWQGAI